MNVRCLAGRLALVAQVFWFFLCGLVSFLTVAQAQLPAAPLPAGMTEQRFSFQGTERRFLEFQSARFAPGAPIVIVLHGGGQSAQKMFRKATSPHQSWLRLAEREGFLLLAPNGTDPRTGDPAGESQHWFDLRNKWPLTNGPPDDVGFIEALADWAVRERQADPKRLYIAGASNGGMMTFRVLIERPEKFAGGAAFNATLPAWKLLEPAVARPIMIALGTKDPVIPWEGGELLKGGIILRSALATLEFWLEAHGLEGEPPVARILMPDLAPDDDCRIERWSWGGSADAPLVLFWVIRGGGHWLPSTQPFTLTPKLLQSMGPRCLDADGPTAAWVFLSSHHLP